MVIRINYWYILTTFEVSVWDQFGHMKQFIQICETASWRDKFFLATLAYSSLGFYHEAIDILENIKSELYALYSSYKCSYVWNILDSYHLPNTNLEYVDRELAMIKFKLRQMCDEGPDLKKKEIANKYIIGDIVHFVYNELSRIVIGYDPLCVPLTVSPRWYQHICFFNVCILLETNVRR